MASASNDTQDFINYPTASHSSTAAHPAPVSPLASSNLSTASSAAAQQGVDTPNIDGGSDTVSTSSVESDAQPPQAEPRCDDVPQDQRRVCLAGRDPAAEITFSQGHQPLLPAKAPGRHVTVPPTSQSALNRKTRRQLAKEEEQQARQRDLELKAREEVRKRSEQRHLLNGQPFEHRPLDYQPPSIRASDDDHSATIALCNLSPERIMAFAGLSLSENEEQWRLDEQRKIAVIEADSTGHADMIAKCKQEMGRLQASLPEVQDNEWSYREVQVRYDEVKHCLQRHLAASDGGEGVMRDHPILSMEEIAGAKEGAGWRSASPHGRARIETIASDEDGTAGTANLASHTATMADSTAGTEYERRFEADGSLVIERSAQATTFSHNDGQATSASRPASASGSTPTSATDSPTKTGKAKKKAVANKRRNEKRKAAKRGAGVAEDNDAASDHEERAPAEDAKGEPQASSAARSHNENAAEERSPNESAPTPEDGSDKQSRSDLTTSISSPTSRDAPAQQAPAAETVVPMTTTSPDSLHPQAGQQHLLPPVQDDQTVDNSPLALGPAHSPGQQGTSSTDGANGASGHGPSPLSVPATSPAASIHQRQATDEGPRMQAADMAALPSISSLTLEEPVATATEGANGQSNSDTVRPDSEPAQTPDDGVGQQRDPHSNKCDSATAGSDSQAEHKDGDVVETATAPEKPVEQGPNQQDDQEIPMPSTRELRSDPAPACRSRTPSQRNSSSDVEYDLPSFVSEEDADYLLGYLEANRRLFAQLYTNALEQGRQPNMVWLPGGVGVLPTSENGSGRVVEFVNPGHPNWIALDDPQRIEIADVAGQEEAEAYSDDGYRPSSSSSDVESSEGGGEGSHGNGLLASGSAGSIATTNLTTPNRSPPIQRKSFSTFADFGLEAAHGSYDAEPDERPNKKRGLDDLEGDFAQRLMIGDSATAAQPTFDGSELSMLDSFSPRMSRSTPAKASSSNAYRLPARLQRLKESLKAKGVYSGMTVQGSAMIEEMDEQSDIGSQPEDVSSEDGGSEEVGDAQINELERRVAERERLQRDRRQKVKQTHGAPNAPLRTRGAGTRSQRENRRNWNVAEQQTSRTMQRASRRARVHISSNKPAVVAQHRRQQSKRQQGADGIDQLLMIAEMEDGETLVLEIEEEAPIRRFAGAEHRRLPRNQVARSLRSRQTGVRVQIPDPTVASHRRIGASAATTTSSHRGSRNSNRFTIENGASAGKQPQRSSAGKRRQNDNAVDVDEGALTDFGDLFAQDGMGRRGGRSQGGGNLYDKPSGYHRQQQARQTPGGPDTFAWMASASSSFGADIANIGGPSTRADDIERGQLPSSNFTFTAGAAGAAPRWPGHSNNHPSASAETEPRSSRGSAPSSSIAAAAQAMLNAAASAARFGRGEKGTNEKDGEEDRFEEVSEGDEDAEGSTDESEAVEGATVTALD